MYKNLRWKIITILVVFVVFFGARGLSDPGAALQAAGARMAGSPNISSSGSTCRAASTSILKVNRDDALRDHDRVRQRAAARGAAGGGRQPPAPSP